MKVIVVLGWKNEKGFWLVKELRKKGYKVKVIDFHKNIGEYRLLGNGRLSNLMGMCASYRLGCKAYRISTENDIILAYSFFPGVMISLISVLRKKQRKILALNNLGREREKKLISKLILSKIYHISFSNSDFFTTGNTNEIKKLINERYGINNENIFVLPDSYNDAYQFNETYDNKAKIVFAGGYENRDWETYLKVAKDRPDYIFKLVCSINNVFDEISNNVIINEDIIENEFMKLMSESHIVIIPLLENYASGLTVLLRAVQMGKIVIATNVSAIKNYFPDELEYLLVPIYDYKKILNLITKIDNFSREEYVEEVNKHKKYIEDNFSPSATINKIIEIFKQSGMEE